MPDTNLEPGLELHLRAADGTLARFTPARPLPTDLIPGEFVHMPVGTGSQWYIFSDKQRFWDGVAWRMTGTVQAFDPSTMTEDEIYELRRKTLSREGWTG